MSKLLFEVRRYGICLLTCFFLIVVLFPRSSVAMGNSKGKGDSLNSVASQKYFFEMEKKQQETFFKDLKLIKLGDSVQKVKKILGEPTYDQKVANKKGEFKARVLDYYIKKWRQNLVNEKYDRYVSLIFNAENKLMKIISNIDEQKHLEKGK